MARRIDLRTLYTNGTLSRCDQLRMRWAGKVRPLACRHEHICESGTVARVIGRNSTLFLSPHFRENHPFSGRTTFILPAVSHCKSTVLSGTNTGTGRGAHTLHACAGGVPQTSTEIHTLRPPVVADAQYKPYMPNTVCSDRCKCRDRPVNGQKRSVGWASRRKAVVIGDIVGYIATTGATLRKKCTSSYTSHTALRAARNHAPMNGHLQ
jgi:hypothetical protein